MTEAVAAPSGPADFGTRFSAWMIDAIGLFALQWVSVIVLARQLQAAGMVSTSPCGVDDSFLCEGPSGGLWAIIFGFIIVSTLGYHAWFDGVLGATPGKRWMGLRVVDGVDPGTRSGSIGWGRGVSRSIVRQGVWLWTFLFLDASPIALDVPSIVFFGAFGLSMATLVWGAYAPSGRALHDHVASTMVVAESSLPSQRPSPAVEVAP